MNKILNVPQNIVMNVQTFCVNVHQPYIKKALLVSAFFVQGLKGADRLGGY